MKDLGETQMKPTESEIKKYQLSKNDTDHFFELIDIKDTDFEVIYGFEQSKPYVYVKFDETFGVQQVGLIMKVALSQLQARINRQKQWDKYNE